MFLYQNICGKLE